MFAATSFAARNGDLVRAYSLAHRCSSSRVIGMQRLRSKRFSRLEGMFVSPREPTLGASVPIDHEELAPPSFGKSRDAMQRNYRCKATEVPITRGLSGCLLVCRETNAGPRLSSPRQVRARGQAQAG